MRDAAWERQCYGCTQDEFMRSVEDSITMKLSPSRPHGLLMCAMSIASDAQEEIARGMSEAARQSLNRVKLLMSVVMQEEAK